MEYVSCTRHTQRLPPTWTIDSVVVSPSKAYLSSLVGMPLLVKAVTSKGTFVVVSSMITLTVQTLESVRTRCTSCSYLSRRVRLGIGLATPSQQSVVLNSMRTTTFLTRIISRLVTSNLYLDFISNLF